jgi:hypothetical protein
MLTEGVAPVPDERGLQIRRPRESLAEEAPSHAHFELDPLYVGAWIGIGQLDSQRVFGRASRHTRAGVVQSIRGAGQRERLA